MKSQNSKPNKTKRAIEPSRNPRDKGGSIRLLRTLSPIILLVLCLASERAAKAQTVAPLGGLGSLQFLDNNGVPLTNGVLYSYQAGTSTQQATYTDSSGTTQNPNPIPFGSGARAIVWLSVGQFYKFVLCQQNDGAFCAPADVLFSVDNVPGGSTSSGGGGGSSPFTGTFISGSPSPATSGILRLASGDQVCWRNAAGSTNLCISKDSNDLLSWSGGSLKFPEVPCPAAQVGFDIVCSDSAAHRWKMANNGGGLAQIVAAGVDINNSDQVIQLHAGASALPICNTSPTSGQVLGWNGTCLGGTSSIVEQAFGWGTFFASSNLTNGASICSGTVASSLCSNVLLPSAHTILRLVYFLVTAPSGCGTVPAVGVRDITAGSNLYSQNIANGASTGFVDSGALSVAIPAGHQIGVGLTVSPSGCGAPMTLYGVTMVYQ